MAEASLRFTRVSRHGDMPTSAIQFISGRNTRLEHRSCSGRNDTTQPENVQYGYGPWRASLVNQNLNHLFELDLDSRIYVAYSMNKWGTPRWIKPRRLPPQEPSGRTVQAHTEMIDTGARKTVFGYTARNVITKSRQSRDGELISESEFDAWYIDPPAAWLALHPPPKPGTFFHLAAGTGKQDAYEFSETGARETGFVVSGTRTHRSYHKDEAGEQATFQTVSFEEVTELSETPLTPNLFVPPPDFARVTQLPDGMRYPLVHRLRLQWEMWKDSLTLPGRIARFTS